MDASEVSLLVNRLLCEEPVPLEVLRGVGNEIPGGFQSRDLRRRVWPKLLTVDRYTVDAAWAQTSDADALPAERKLQRRELRHSAARRRLERLAL